MKSKKYNIINPESIYNGFEKKNFVDCFPLLFDSGGFKNVNVIKKELSEKTDFKSKITLEYINYIEHLTTLYCIDCENTVIKPLDKIKIIKPFELYNGFVKFNKGDTHVFYKSEGFNSFGIMIQSIFIPYEHLESDKIKIIKS